MKILFDETQKERGKIYDNFQKLAQILEDSGHDVERLESFPIKYSNISNADILVFLCPDGSKIYGHEIKSLLRFVDEGGSLAIFANAGGDSGLNTNLNTLLKHFNIEIISNQIFDYQNFDLNLESNPVITKFFEHPITEGIKEVTVVSSCSLQVGDNVIELARTQITSDPPSAAIMAISSYGLGTVFVCGSYLMFSDKKSGIELRENGKLITNIFNYISISGFKVTEEEKEEEEEAFESSTEEEEIIAPKKQKDKIDLVKEALEKTETDTVKSEVIKAIQSLREEVKATKSETKEPEVKLTKEDIYSSIAIIKELEKEIENLKIEDPGYRDILITDMARRKGIDYNLILPYLEKIREKEKREMKKKDEGIHEEKREIDISSIPTPTTLDQFQKEIAIFDHRDDREQKNAGLSQIEQTKQIDELINSIKELKNSVDILSANLIHLLSEIVLEIKEQKGKKRIF